MMIFILMGVVFGIYQFTQGNLSRAFLGLGAVAFLLIPLLMKRLVGEQPYRLYCALFVFCIIAYDFGCVMQWFDAIPFFDKISHFLSGILFTAIGYCYYYYLVRRRPEQIGENTFLACTYALFFSVFIAVLWEIFEFTGFLLIGHDSQHTLTTGVFDTMEDIIACLIGSLISMCSFLIYVKNGVRFVTIRIVDEFYSILRTANTNGNK